MEFKAIIKSPFINIFIDSVVFAQLAEVTGSQQFQEAARFARASISSAVLSIECAANCCLAQLSNGGSFRHDIDKLPFISKFEIFHSLNFQGRAFDRGCIEIQKIQELKSIRDCLVHPKRKTVSLKKEDEQEGQVLFNQECGIWKLNGISRLESAWNHEDAIKVLNAATAFFNFYFLDLCGFNHNRVCKILFDEFVIEPPLKSFDTRYDMSRDENLKKAVSEWGIEFKFLGIVSTS